MPFIAYERLRRRSRTELVRRDNISLGGKWGPFAAHVRRTAKAHAGDEFAWELSEQQLLDHAGYAGAQHSLLIDMKPQDRHVSLYQLRRVWGHSSRDWTVVVFQLRPLFVDERRKRPATFKRRFVEPRTNGELVHEFLYLKGGTLKGNWNWGRSGSVNAALLWPETYKHFHSRITRHI